MPTYTTDANLLRELPASLPSELDTSTKRLPHIIEASTLADALVGPRFPPNAAGQRFPSISDTPPTPPLIEMATRLLAASLVYDALHTINGETGISASESLRNEALTWFTRIRNGELALTNTDGTVTSAAHRITSTTRGTEPTFRSSRRAPDGTRIDTTAGSLDYL